jgi:hypothetical protein
MHAAHSPHTPTSACVLVQVCARVLVPYAARCGESARECRGVCCGAHLIHLVLCSCRTIGREYVRIVCIQSIVNPPITVR